MEAQNSSLDIRGTLTIEDPDSPGDYIKVVYQGVSAQFANYENKLKKPRQIRAHVIPTDPMTSAQLTQRGKLASAVAAWQIATPEEKETARPTALKKSITLYMAFISDYIKAIPPITGTQWDAGLTVWIDGITPTLWDI